MEKVKWVQNKAGGKIFPFFSNILWVLHKKMRSIITGTILSIVFAIKFIATFLSDFATYIGSFLSDSALQNIEPEKSLSSQQNMHFQITESEQFSQVYVSYKKQTKRSNQHKHKRCWKYVYIKVDPAQLYHFYSSCRW